MKLGIGIDLCMVEAFVAEMKATSSTNNKKDILKKYDTPELRKLFLYVYNPFTQYYVTSKTLKKNKDKSFDNYADLYALLDDLSNRLITGHNAIECVNGFITNYAPQHEELIHNIIDRDLKTRATATLINDVMPGTVPSFNVALAEKFNQFEKKVNFTSGEWWGSRKLDGLRCICIIDKLGDVRFFSRAGNEFFTLSKLAEDIKRLGLKSKVIDGEICIIGEDGLEDFQGILKEAKNKNHTIEHPMFYMFDFLELDEFNSGTGDATFVVRQLLLNEICKGLKYAQVLEQIQITSREQFDKLAKDAVALGHEGIMIRKNACYIGDRSSDILKVKVMEDAEYVVTGHENAINRIINKKTKAEEEELMLKCVYIMHRGCQVSVGSGFSLAQRREFYRNPELIVGKVITVQYFEESVNEQGGHSLRFPVFKGLHGNSREL